MPIRLLVSRQFSRPIRELLPIQDLQILLDGRRPGRLRELSFRLLLPLTDIIAADLPKRILLSGINGNPNPMPYRNIWSWRRSLCPRRLHRLLRRTLLLPIRVRRTRWQVRQGLLLRRSVHDPRSNYALGRKRRQRVRERWLLPSGFEISKAVLTWIPQRAARTRSQRAVPAVSARQVLHR